MINSYIIFKDYDMKSPVGTINLSVEGRELIEDHGAELKVAFLMGEQKKIISFGLVTGK